MSIQMDENGNIINQGPGVTGDTSLPPGLPSGSLEDQLYGSAVGIEAEENRRREEGLGVLQREFDQSRSTLSDLIDPDLLFSRAADSIGARGKRTLSGLMKNFAGRGIRPGSGAFQGAMSRFALGSEGQRIGAQRDVALANQQQRREDAGTLFGMARTMAGAIASPVSGAKHSTLQNLYEGEIAREGIDKGVAAQRASSKDRKMGSLGGGLLGLAGSAFGK